MSYSSHIRIEETEVYREWINTLLDRAGRARIQVPTVIRIDWFTAIRVTIATSPKACRS